MKEQILVVTHRKAFEADPVIDGLREKGASVFRFNADPAVDGTEINLSLANGGVQGFLSCDNRGLIINDVSVAWFQQPPSFFKEPSTPAENLQRVNFEAAFFALLGLLNCKWINQPDFVFNASNKAVQLCAAQKVGLLIPKTIISNSTKAIRSFYCGNNKTIAKNLATPWLHQSNTVFAAYTKLVSKEWLEKDKELQFAPVIFQEFVGRTSDYRVVVVGEKIFPVVCIQQMRNQQYDVRRDQQMLEGFSQCRIDKAIEKKIIKLMDLLRLDYCSADFMEIQDERFVFLELNVTGSWWWVDKLYDGEIRNSIVDLILDKRNGEDRE